MSIDRKQIKLMGIMLSVMLVLGVGPLAYNYFAEKSLDARIVLAKESLGIERGSAEDLSSLHYRVQELEDALNNRQHYVPDTPEIAKVLRSLTDALVRYQVQDQAIETRPNKSYLNYSAIPLSIRFEADFLSTYAAIREIESMSRLIRIDRLNIRSVPGRDLAEPQIEMEVTTFFAPNMEGGSL